MPGPKQTTSQIHNSHDHRQCKVPKPHEPRRQSLRNPKPSLRAREIIEALTKQKDIPLPPGKKKRFRVSELRTTKEPEADSLSREEKKRKITTRSVSMKNDTGKSKPEQREASRTSLTTKPTKPTTAIPNRKKSCTNPSQPRSAQHAQSQRLSADETVEGVKNVPEEEKEEEEEEEKEEEENNRDGGSKFEDPKALQAEGLNPEEADAFRLDEDIRVNEFENSLMYLRKKGGSSRSREDIEEEQKNLGIQTKDGRLEGLTLDELESGHSVRVPGVRKKRSYQRTSYADMADDIEPRMKRLEELTRVTFLSTLDPDTCQALVDRVFPEYTDFVNDAWVRRAASRRVRQNTAQWKSRTLKAMRVWVEKVFEMNTAGRQLQDHIFNAAKLRLAFESHYSIDKFEHIFSFTRYYVNLRKSSPRARWWAQQIFLNLAAYTKCVLDVESGRSPAINAADLRRLSQAGLCRVFNDIGKKDVFRQYRPALDEYFFDEHAASKRRK